MTVRVTGTGLGHTRIEVTDPDPRALPTLLSASETAESGRGLTLVDALARRWGVEQGADRKTVWCELAEQEQQLGRPREDERRVGTSSAAATERTELCGVVAIAQGTDHAPQDPERV
ncbi:ATP-binding protein [Streptomyces sp. NPDC050287]|uniref:ATP-binding protein n=1 Tax=Streptomyces sp. NPDC050287 TaxID=3365608 RepID=UPI0037AF7AD2